MTSALGLAPVCWVVTGIGFLLVRCVHSTIGFLPICRLLRAFKFSPVRCEGVVRYPLVALFLLLLAEVEPWRECSGLWRVSPLVYEDFWVSRLVDGLGQASCYCGAWEFMSWARCARVASIRSIVALTASTSRSTCVKCYVCSFSSMVESWLFWAGPWTCSWVEAKALDTY